MLLFQVKQYHHLDRIIGLLSSVVSIIRVTERKRNVNWLREHLTCINNMKIQKQSFRQWYSVYLFMFMCTKILGSMLEFPNPIINLKNSQHSARRRLDETTFRNKRRNIWKNGLLELKFGLDKTMVGSSNVSKVISSSIRKF